MTRSQKLISALVLLAATGPFGRAAFAAAEPAAETPVPAPAVVADTSEPAVEPVTPAAEVPAPVVTTPAPAAAPAAAPAPAPEATDPTAADITDSGEGAEEGPAEEPTEPAAEVESTVAETTPAPAPLAPAADTTYDGAAAEFLAATNGSRAAVGVAPLVANASLSAYAAQHAAAMAGANNLHHSDISVLLGGWSSVGENVGVGPSVGAIHAALLASPGHYRNLSDAGFTHVGIGVYVDAGGRTWTAHVFGA